MNNKLIAIDSEGNKRQINILFVFNENNGKDYLFFTEDESKDESNEVFVKRYVKKDGYFLFEEVETEEEWVMLEKVFDDVIKRTSNPS